MADTMTDLSELEKLARAATPGPWEVWRDGHGCLSVGGDDTVAVLSYLCEEDHAYIPLEDAVANAAYIAAANPATILALIAERDALRAGLEQVRNTTHSTTGYCDLSARRAAFKVANEALTRQPETPDNLMEGER